VPKGLWKRMVGTRKSKWTTLSPDFPIVGDVPNMERLHDCFLNENEGEDLVEFPNCISRFRPHGNC